MCSFQKDETSNYVYLGSGTILTQAIKKYGRDKFIREILQECSSHEELSEAERLWIKRHDAVNSSEFYNLSYGGFGGNSQSTKEYWARYTEDERKEARNWNRCRHNPMLGKNHSDETKAKIGLRSKNRNWNHPNHSGSNNPKAQKCKITFNNKEEIFECMKDFADKYNLKYSAIKSISLNGPTTRGKYSGITIEKV